MLATKHLRIDQVKSPVVHLGYVRERAASKNKKARDLAILVECIKSDPVDLYSRMKVLELARFWGDRSLWHTEAVAARDALERGPAVKISSERWGGEFISLISEGIHQGPEPEALAFLNAYEARIFPSAAFYHRRGQCHELSGHIDFAARDYKTCLTLGSNLGNMQLATTRPLLGLSRLALMQNQLAEALKLANEALVQAPQDPEAMLAVSTLSAALK